MNKQNLISKDLYEKVVPVNPATPEEARSLMEGFGQQYAEGVLLNYFTDERYTPFLNLIMTSFDLGYAEQRFDAETDGKLCDAIIKEAIKAIFG